MADSTFVFRGGLDLEADYLTIPPGRLLGCKNFEPNLGTGYTRIAGYERFDGQPAPSDAVYATMDVSLSETLTVGAVVTGGTSGATATVVAKTGDSGAVTIVLTKITGTFSAAETITSSLDTPSTVGTVTTTQLEGGESDPDLDAQYQLLAADEYRDDIAAIPGSGSVLGVHKHDGVVYAFRNNSGGTAADMYKSTAAGWVQVSMPDILLFDTGLGTEVVAGDTIEGATSLATADVDAVVTYSGTWGTDAAGYLVLSNVTGTFLNNENIRVNGGGLRFKANGANYTHTLSPSGAYQLKSFNFQALDSTYNMYGCDGVNPAFEFDGTVFAPILLPDITGAPATNAPTLLEEHKGHLFLMFGNGLVQHSVQGEPKVFNGFLGAAEFGLGSAGTAMVSEAGGTLLLRTARETYGIYGNTVSDWELRKVSTFGGSVIHTTERFGDVISFDSKGIVLQSRVEKFGDFESATVSRQIQTEIDRLYPLITRSVLVRSKNQYRVYASDGSFLIMVPRNDGTFEFTTGEYDDAVTCISNNEDEAGSREEIYFGSNNGFVYQAEVGNSFDGEPIESFLTFAFNHAELPRHRKRFRRLFLDAEFYSSAVIRFSSEATFGDPDVLNTLLNNQSHAGGQGALWGSGTWGEFYWGAQTRSQMRFDVTGTGLNLAATLYNRSEYVSPFTLYSAQMSYDVRRKER